MLKLCRFPVIGPRANSMFNNARHAQRRSATAHTVVLQSQIQRKRNTASVQANPRKHIFPIAGAS